MGVEELLQVFVGLDQREEILIVGVVADLFLPFLEHKSQFLDLQVGAQYTETIDKDHNDVDNFSKHLQCSCSSVSSIHCFGCFSIIFNIINNKLVLEFIWFFFII